MQHTTNNMTRRVILQCIIAHCCLDPPLTYNVINKFKIFRKYSEKRNSQNNNIASQVYDISILQRVVSQGDILTIEFQCLKELPSEKQTRASSAVVIKCAGA